jgi:hypothetical protein
MDGELQAESEVPAGAAMLRDNGMVRTSFKQACCTYVSDQAGNASCMPQEIVTRGLDTAAVLLKGGAVPGAMPLLLKGSIIPDVAEPEVRGSKCMLP